MRFTDKLFHPIQNCEETTIVLCKALQIAYTRKALVGALLTHPDYPSLLAVSDVMKDYGVENISIYLKDTKELMKISQPFIAQIVSENKSGKIFALVYSVSETKVSWYNPEKHKREEVAFDEFAGRFTGYMQVFQKGEVCGENEYEVNRLVEKQQCIKEYFYIYSIPILAVIISVISIIKNGVIISAFPILYTFLVLAGAVVGIMLLMYEVDQYNPTLRKVCSIGQKTSCSAILNSHGAKIFGIHWSIIGFSYFMGILLVLLASGIVHSQLLNGAAWLSIMALPYIVYSIYYQARVAHQWCPMCLAVQGILLLLFFTSLAGGFLLDFDNLSWNAILPYIIDMLFVFLATSLLLPAWEKAKVEKQRLVELQRLKHNSSIFEALLSKEKHITEFPEGLGITLGNPNGKLHLIKVCNPYCNPCAKAHPHVDRLIDNNPDICLQIIFLSSAGTEDDERLLPIKHLMAIAASGDVAMIRQALDDWYLSKRKDYAEFVLRYPVTQSQLQAQMVSINNMRKWIDKFEIGFTPAFFINGYLLPDLYTVQDLEYFLSI